LNKGTNVFLLTENGKAVEGANGLYATACYDKNTKSHIVKIANTSNEEKDITVTFNGLKKLNAGKVTVLHSEKVWLSAERIPKKYSFLRNVIRKSMVFCGIAMENA